MDIDELVDIQRQEPIGLPYGLFLARQLQPCELDAALVIGAVIADMRDPAQFSQPVAHGVRAIAAIIGADHEVGEAHRPVMRQPVQQERALVAQAKDGSGAHQLSISSASA